MSVLFAVVGNPTNGVTVGFQGVVHIGTLASAKRVYGGLVASRKLARGMWLQYPASYPALTGPGSAHATRGASIVPVRGFVPFRFVVAYLVTQALSLVWRRPTSYKRRPFLHVLSMQFGPNLLQVPAPNWAWCRIGVWAHWARNGGPLGVLKAVLHPVRTLKFLKQASQDPWL